MRQTLHSCLPERGLKPATTYSDATMECEPRRGVGIDMSKRSILVVDDDRSVRSYLSDFLSSCGYTVECAESGDQAVARLSAGYVPSLIVLDIVMPGISGIETLESVKKINSSISVIILSAAGQTKTIVDAMKMGAADFLVKPFEEQELEIAIENVIEKQKLKDEVKTLKRRLDQYSEQ